MVIPFDYELADQDLRVKLGPWTVRRIRYDDVTGVRNGHPFWNEHWTNVWPWRFLTLRRKSGIIRNFVINPPDREAFAAELRLRARLP